MKEEIDKALQEVVAKRDKERKSSIEHWKASGLDKYHINKKISWVDTMFSNQLKKWNEEEPFRNKVIEHALSLSNSELVDAVSKAVPSDNFCGQIIYTAELKSRLKKAGFIE